MSYQFEYIAIHHADGRVSRMQFVLQASPECFDARGAANAGFTFDKASNHWLREATQENVQREIARASIPKNVDGWKPINRADMDTVRQDYGRIPARKQLPTKP